jgi:hypothetical protein
MTDLQEHSRKDFRFVAGLLNKIDNSKDRQKLADTHAAQFSAVNPKFDHEKWHTACGTKMGEEIEMNATTKTTMDPLEELIEVFIAENPNATDEEVIEGVELLLKAESLISETDQVIKDMEETEPEVTSDETELLTELVGTAISDEIDNFTVKFDLGMQTILAALLNVQKTDMQAEMFGVKTIKPEETQDDDLMEIFAEYLDAHEYADIAEAVEAFATELEMDDESKKLFAAEVKKVMDESELPAIPSGVIVQGTTAQERAKLNQGGGKRSVTAPDPIRKLGTSAEIERKINKGEARPHV